VYTQDVAPPPPPELDPPLLLLPPLLLPPLVGIVTVSALPASVTVTVVGLVGGLKVILSGTLTVWAMATTTAHSATPPASKRMGFIGVNSYQ
jgi:hypothetical protein